MQVALEGRAGALSSICSFLRHCPQLATSEDITKRLMGPLDAAVTMLSRSFLPPTPLGLGLDCLIQAVSSCFKLFQVISSYFKLFRAV